MNLKERYFNLKSYKKKLKKANIKYSNAFKNFAANQKTSKTETQKKCCHRLLNYKICGLIGSEMKT